MLNYKNKNTNINTNINKYILFGILIFFLVISLFAYYSIQNNKIIEGIQFNSNEFKNEYKTLNIIYDKTNHRLIRKYPGKVKIFDCKNINNRNSVKITSNKYYTSDLLNKNQLPVPKFMLYDNNNNNNNNNVIQHNLQYPLVIKPLSESGGKDITMNNNNIQDLQKNINKLTSYDKLLIEEQLVGNDYRILIYNNEVIDVILRNKPSVIGNGIDNISDLISKYNINLTHGNFAIHNIDTKVLKEQNKNLRSIPKNGELVIVSKVCNYHNGAKLNRIPLNTVHIDNIDLALKAVNITNNKLAGIDFISKDISVSWKKNGAKIIEMNSSPCLLIHKYAIDNTNQNIPYKFFTKLFEPFINL